MLPIGSRGGQSKTIVVAGIAVDFSGAGASQDVREFSFQSVGGVRTQKYSSCHRNVAALYISNCVADDSRSEPFRWRDRLISWGDDPRSRRAVVNLFRYTPSPHDVEH